MGNDRTNRKKDFLFNLILVTKLLSSLADYLFPGANWCLEYYYLDILKEFEVFVLRFLRLSLLMSVHLILTENMMENYFHTIIFLVRFSVFGVRKLDLARFVFTLQLLLKWLGVVISIAGPVFFISWLFRTNHRDRVQYAMYLFGYKTWKGDWLIVWRLHIKVFNCIF